MSEGTYKDLALSFMWGDLMSDNDENKQTANFLVYKFDLSRDELIAAVAKALDQAEARGREKGLEEAVNQCDDVLKMMLADSYSTETGGEEEVQQCKTLIRALSRAEDGGKA